MKKSTIYIAFLLIGISTMSCKKNNDGLWKDDIKLSSKDVVLTSLPQSKTITAQSTNWWLSDISLNGNNVDLSNIDKLAKTFVITQPEFRIERLEDGKKIIISMTANNTNADRTLLISMQNGDYFTGIKVTQTK